MYAPTCENCSHICISLQRAFEPLYAVQFSSTAFIDYWDTPPLQNSLLLFCVSRFLTDGRIPLKGFWKPPLSCEIVKEDSER